VGGMLDSSRHGFCVVVNDGRIVLGRLWRSNLEAAEPGRLIEQVMEPGPSTVRPGMPRSKPLSLGRVIAIAYRAVGKRARSWELRPNNRHHG
jgi:hypothetical protein